MDNEYKTFEISQKRHQSIMNSIGIPFVVNKFTSLLSEKEIQYIKKRKPKSNFFLFFPEIFKPDKLFSNEVIQIKNEQELDIHKKTILNHLPNNSSMTKDDSQKIYHLLKRKDKNYVIKRNNLSLIKPKCDENSNIYLTFEDVIDNTNFSIDNKTKYKLENKMNINIQNQDDLKNNKYDFINKSDTSYSSDIELITNNRRKMNISTNQFKGILENKCDSIREYKSLTITKDLQNNKNIHNHTSVSKNIKSTLFQTLVNPKDKEINESLLKNSVKPIFKKINNTKQFKFYDSELTPLQIKSLNLLSKLKREDMRKEILQNDNKNIFLVKTPSLLEFKKKLERASIQNYDPSVNTTFNMREKDKHPKTRKTLKDLSTFKDLYINNSSISNYIRKDLRSKRVKDLSLLNIKANMNNFKNTNFTKFKSSNNLKYNRESLDIDEIKSIRTDLKKLRKDNKQAKTINNNFKKENICDSITKNISKRHEIRDEIFNKMNVRNSGAKLVLKRRTQKFILFDDDTI